MNFDDRVRAADSTLDDRLRAAGSALREGSVTQIDAAGRLREIVRHADEASPEPVIQLGPSPVRSVASLRRRTQRRALAVNLLLSLVLGVVLGIVFQRSQVPDPPVPPERTVAAVTPTTTTTEAQARTATSVPEACLDTAELADEVISKLNRNVRDKRLFLALRDYTIASQACRRASSP
jgi:hypothetical protein